MLSHLYPDGRSRIFNVYALVWAVGAASGPLVVTAALALGNWRFAYLGLALAFLPAVYLVYRLDLPVSLGSEETLRFADLSSVLRQPGIIGMMVALFLSGGIEGSMVYMAPLLRHGASPSRARELDADSISAGVYPGSISLQRYC